MNKLHDLQERLFCNLSEVNNLDEKEEYILDHLKKISSLIVPLDMSALIKDQDWLNTSEALSWDRDLQGRLLVLDFFTYCCVNCLHVLPSLKRLEKRFPPETGLTVVGVHSAKFLNEKVTANVASAILQYDITHCVLNDPHATLWHELGISCWPTLLILGPSGIPLFILMGESHEEELFLFCKVALDFFATTLRPRPLLLKLLRDVSASCNLLRFPGKVISLPPRMDIVVADTGNNRILILSSQGVLEETIGGPEPGWKDGVFSKCRFNHPQGLAFDGRECVYVADTENHTIRLINMRSGHVTTVAGTGMQGTDREGGGAGRDQPISTPWDLCLAPVFGSTPGAESVNVLYIAMAGLHQIWALLLHDTRWPKCSKPLKAGTCMSVVGSGNEENRNNAYPQRAGLAQPSGLTYSSSLHCLFVADSESSSVRSISLVDGSVKAVVGASKDPSDLFAFGDVDGTSLDAKLQHPLGLTWSQENDCIFLADTYNHKIKKVDPVSRKCSQISIEYQFGEPGGLCMFGSQHLLVADTQNHSIVKITLDTIYATASPLPVVVVSSEEETQLDGIKMHDSDYERSVSVLPGSSLTISLSLCLQEGLEFAIGAPQSWSLLMDQTEFSEDQIVLDYPRKGSINIDGSSTKFVITFVEKPATFHPVFRLKSRAYICDKTSKVCLSRDALWLLNIDLSIVESPEETIALDWQISK